MLTRAESFVITMVFAMARSNDDEVTQCASTVTLFLAVGSLFGKFRFFLTSNRI